MSKQKISELQTERAKFKPVLPSIIKNGPAKVITKFGTPTKSVSDYETVQKLFPNTYGMPTVNFIKGKKSEVAKKIIKVGVVLSGGQAPGGHNVIAGLFDALKKANSKNKLIGFSATTWRTNFNPLPRSSGERPETISVKATLNASV